MMGTPSQILVSIGISARFSLEHIEELYSGIRLACEVYGVDLVGGDTNSSVTGITIGITCVGDSENPVYRTGAKENDLICVSGDLGAAYMGLQILEREKRLFKGEKDFNPEFSGKEYLLERYLKPEARKDIVASLISANIKPSSMIDVSDGLASDILHICNDNNLGCRIYEDKIPIDYQTALQAEQFNMSLITAALNGGEDYELLFTVPLGKHDLIETIPGIRIIGHMTDSSLGSALITRDGAEIELKAQGWGKKED